MHARVLVPRVVVLDATPRRPHRDRIVARAVPSLVCLDRDGVINVDVGPPGVTDVEQFALIPGAARAVGALNDAGATVCVVTNQTAVGKGFMEERYLTDVVHEEMRRALTREDARATISGGIYYACKARSEPCRRRKPAPGMILEACEANGVDASSCAFVGDTVTDMQAAGRAGARRLLVCTGYGTIMGEALRRNNVALPTRIWSRVDDPTMSFPDECFPMDVYEDLLHCVECILNERAPRSPI
jgi:D-glycero-D-manno-heptose 1,7-bisphosphate phosphatase|tara:strand:+ start:1982 stop:2713 length:732 start_codon:yes stop_codon:yes gene_type:complete